MTKLTELQVKNTKPGDKVQRIGDGDGLYLSIAPLRASGKGGGKSWVFVSIREGKRSEVGLGSYPDVSLKDARKRAAENQLRLRGGKAPVSYGAQRTRKQTGKDQGAVPPSGITFKDYAELFITQHEVGWRNDKHRAQWRSTLATYCYPVFGHKAVADVEIDDVKNALTPIWHEKQETASRIRERIERILTTAKVEGKRTGDNPAARDIIVALLGKQNRKPKHRAAMPYADIPAFFGRLKGQQGMGALALQFAVLTATRSGEVRLARWSELDLDAAVWTIPPERMKADREHRVPLNAPALEILRVRKLAQRTDGNSLVFPGEGMRGMKRPADAECVMSDMTMSAVLRRMGFKGVNVTVHGFRSTLRDWTGDKTDYPREVAEAALSHKVGDKAEQAYRRGTAFEKRTELMKLWGEYCLSGIKGLQGDGREN